RPEPLRQQLADLLRGHAATAHASSSSGCWSAGTMAARTISRSRQSTWCCASHVALRRGLGCPQRAALILGEPAPDAELLGAVQRPPETLVDHGATPADGLGLLGLQERRARRADGEPDLWIVVPACRPSTPIAHRPTSL